MARAIPESRGPGVLDGLRFGSDPLGFVERVQTEYADAVSIPLPFRAPLVVVTNPALVHDALSRPDDFARPPTLDSASRIAEHGIVQSEGDRWRRQRRVMTPGFGGDRVTAYARETATHVAALTDRWRDRGPHRVNLHRELTTLTLRVASRVLLGVTLDRDTAERFHGWMAAAGHEFEFGLDTAAPDWLPTPTSPEFHDAARSIRGLAADVIRERIAALADADDPDPPDVLGRLLLAAAATDPTIPPSSLVDHVATLLIAGHETTALSLGYTLSLLSWHPDEHRRVRDEARQVLGDHQPAPSHVDGLATTRRAYDEALRLYPPAWAIFRRATDTVPLGTYMVEADAAVILPQWSIHRDPRYFDDPDRFHPGRWVDTDPGDMPAYFPFASGPHACIGRQFAITGATITLAAIVRDVDVHVPRDALDDLMVTPTLRPPDGIPARITAA